MHLDTSQAHPYKSRPSWTAALLVLWPAAAWSGTGPGGVQLPDGVQKVGENRYRAQGDWEATEKYFKAVYPPSAFPRKPIVNQPGVKAVHIVNPTGKGFEGLNIYEANDEVRIYVVLAEKEKKKEPGKPAKKKREQK